MAVRPETLSERGTPAFLGIRQQHMNCVILAELDLSDLAPGEFAGVVVRQSEKDYVTFLITMPHPKNTGMPNSGSVNIASNPEAGKLAAQLQLMHRRNGISSVVAETTVYLGANPSTKLGIYITGQEYQFTYFDEPKDNEPISDAPISDAPISDAPSGAGPLSAEPNGTVLGTVDGRSLDTATTGGFLGLWLGIYATSQHRPSKGVLNAKAAYFVTD